MKPEEPVFCIMCFFLKKKRLEFYVFLNKENGA